MQKLLAELEPILEAELGLYDEIRALLDVERDALLGGSPDDVLDAARRKDTLLLRVRALDESRLILCLRLARLWNVRAPDVTLGLVAERCEDAVMRGRFEALRRRFRETVDDVRARNERNAAACRHGLETVQTVMSAVLRAEPAPGYSNPNAPKGSKGGAGTRAASLDVRT